MTRFKSFDEAAEKSHPSADIHHEITWWITRPMTLEEWSRLDDLMDDVLAQVVGDDFMGVAGPIPELGE